MRKYELRRGVCDATMPLSRRVARAVVAPLYVTLPRVKSNGTHSHFVIGYRCMYILLPRYVSLSLCILIYPF